MPNEITTKQLRSFGLTVGGIFGLIALWPLVIRAEHPRWWAVVVAVCLLAPAVVFPRILVWVYRGWMALGHVLGWINTRIILGLVFYLVITPIGILRRWLSKDPMGRKLKPEVDSYRVICSPRPASHLKKQY
jgi:O-antigen/teichoic acid export membrane protein